MAMLVIAWMIYYPVYRIALARKRILYLRAFSRDNDEADRALRQVIRAALPREINLSGTRSLKDRTGFHWRLLGPSFTAFRYIGSDSFELEASNRNWLARLLATLSSSQAVLLDVRTLTKSVYAEVTLVLKLCTEPGRLFVIVDDSKSEDDWLALIRRAAEGVSVDFANIRFLSVPVGPETDRKRLAARFREEFRAIPAEPLKINETSFAFVRQNVPQEDWKTSWWETPAVITYSLPPSLSVLAYFFPRAGLVFSVVVTVVIVVVFEAALTRLWRSWFRQRTLGGQGPAGLFVSLAGFAMVGILAAAGLGASSVATDKAKIVSARNDVATFEPAVRNFYSDYASLPLKTSEDITTLEIPISGGAGIAVLEALLGLEEDQEKLNPRQIRFLSYRDVPTRSSGKGGLLSAQGKPVAFIDPWGNDVIAVFAADYDGEIRFTWGGTSITIRSIVAIYSKGPDGKAASASS